MITLYGFPNSRSLRVAWTLEELSVNWDYVYVDFAQGMHKSAAFLKLNPGAKIPVLTDGELVISESVAICQYLAEKYGQGKLLPEAGSEGSARYFSWLSFIISELEQPLWTMAKHKFALPAEKRCREIMPTAQWEFEQAASIAERWLGQTEFIIGRQFTLADILLTQTLNWAVYFKQTLPPNLEAYRLRLSARPALQAAIDREQPPH
jgi:glutathione S-transferase